MQKRVCKLLIECRFLKRKKGKKMSIRLNLSYFNSLSSWFRFNWCASGTTVYYPNCKSYGLAQKLQEKSLSTGIFTLPAFISPESVHGTVEKRIRTCMFLIFGMGQALLFQPRKNKDNHYGSAGRMEAFKSVLFYLTF